MKECVCGRMVKEGDLCKCGRYVTVSGRTICHACANGNCSECVSFFDEDEVCDHECFYQSYYGRPADVGFITPTDW
ncbi:MAG: hypothetical protein QXZ11_07770 [Thermoproteota archaeon]